MDIVEIKKHKQGLEDFIRRSLDDFQSVTGVAVTAVDVTMIDARAVGTHENRFIAAEVRLQLEI